MLHTHMKTWIHEASTVLLDASCVIQFTWTVSRNAHWLFQKHTNAAEQICHINVHCRSGSPSDILPFFTAFYVTGFSGISGQIYVTARFNELANKTWEVNPQAPHLTKQTVIRGDSVTFHSLSPGIRMLTRWQADQLAIVWHLNGIL